MKKLSIVLIAGALLSGCVVYEGPYRDGDGYQRDHRDGDRGRGPHRADHDRDGVPDRQDSRPNDPRRY